MKQVLWTRVLLLHHYPFCWGKRENLDDCFPIEWSGGIENLKWVKAIASWSFLKKITWETFVLWNVSTHLVDRLYKQFSFENKLFFLEFEGTLCYLSCQCWGHLLSLTVCGWGIWAGLSLGTLLFHMVLTWVHIVAFSKWLAGLVWRDQECKCLTPWWWCLEGWSQLDPYSFRTSLDFFFIF